MLRVPGSAPPQLTGVRCEVTERDRREAEREDLDRRDVPDPPGLAAASVAAKWEQ